MEDMSLHAAEILMLKAKNPNSSFVDLIDDYCAKTSTFDIEEFCEYLKIHNKTLKEYIREDLIKFNYVKDDNVVMWAELF